ncbi:MAG: c-type cytochrome, partial [Planctomycetes bacterium]|nr:c-type cytochrome [Planctomycetota bacterium]
SADGLLASVLLDAAPGSRTRALWRPLASIVGSRRDEGQVGRVLQTLGELPPGDGAAEKQAECLAGLLEGLERGGASATSAPTAAAGLRLLLASSDARVREPAARTARLLRIEQTPEMKAIVDDAGRTALDETQPLEARARAARLLAAAPPDDLKTFADQLLDHRQPVEVQLAAVEALGAADDAAAMSLLLEKFPSFTPRLSAAVMDAFFAKQERLPMLLEALEQSAIPASSLDAVRRDQLNNSPKSEIAARARKLLAPEKGTAERQSVLDHYASGLRLPRDAARGKAVFDKQCAKCHKLGGEGYEVGPDLLTAKTRSDETLLSDIMDPSSQITVGYGQYTVITETGRIFNGVLAAETATSVTLRAEENKETVLLRKEIDEMAASRVSMMPEDLEKEVTPQDIADLIGFLRQSLGPTLPSRLVLVDDDPAFPLTLTEGDGRVWLESTDAHAGNAALAVAPPQRFAAKIPGWEFRVAEQPALGEFRYLRFAWKQPAGDGVMLELAADGGWPEPNDSRCRYFSGRNTTDWDAVQVAADRPVEWTVVTRDLWRDFGSFTLTGIAPTAMGGIALFDRIELLRSLDEAE